MCNTNLYRLVTTSATAPSTVLGFTNSFTNDSLPNKTFNDFRADNRTVCSHQTMKAGEHKGEKTSGSFNEPTTEIHVHVYKHSVNQVLLLLINSCSVCSLLEIGMPANRAMLDKTVGEILSSIRSTLNDTLDAVERHLSSTDLEERKKERM